MPAVMAALGAMAADAGMISMIVLMARIALFAHHFLRRGL
jgi:hypothetical protein